MPGFSRSLPALFFALACSSQVTTEESVVQCAPGTQGCACLDDDRCNADLECESSTCAPKRDDSQGGSGGTSAADGSTDEPPTEGECAMERDIHWGPPECQECMDTECCEAQQGCDFGTPCHELERCLDFECGDLDQYECVEPGKPCAEYRTDEAALAWNVLHYCAEDEPCKVPCREDCRTKIRSPNESCDSCLRDNCCAELQGCDEGTPCSELIKCIERSGCATWECVDEKCAAERELGGTEHTDFLWCGDDHCQAECAAGSTSDSTDTGGGAGALPLITGWILGPASDRTEGPSTWDFWDLPHASRSR